MKIIETNKKTDWEVLLRRSGLSTAAISTTVSALLAQIRTEGDKAVKRLGARFDKVELDELRVSAEEINEAQAQVSPALKSALEVAKQNIAYFHSAQRVEEKKIVTTTGVTCWQKQVPIQKVGLYIPGGTAPLFSTVLMLAVPAQIAGCKEIVLCTPPNKQGKVHPAILYAAQLAGVTQIFKMGGVQAIGAMAYGTMTVPKVDKIFGPGNQYVMEAKQQVSLKDVAIDMPAGPSEVAVLADEEANPVFVASDLLSQAEHGVDSQALLMTTSLALAQATAQEVKRQLALLPRKDMAEKALENSRILVLPSLKEAIDLVNAYAPEHLIIQTKAYAEVAEQVVNAGSVFLGAYTPESAGDYASGTNHTLPTNGYARAYSGVNLDSFMRRITFQEITPQGLEQIGDAIEEMAKCEALYAHQQAVRLRRAALKNKQS